MNALRLAITVVLFAAFLSGQNTSRLKTEVTQEDYQAATALAGAFIADVQSGDLIKAAKSWRADSPASTANTAVKVKYLETVLKRCGQPIGRPYVPGDPIVWTQGNSDGQRQAGLAFEYFYRTSQQTTRRFDVVVERVNDSAFQVVSFECKALKRDTEHPLN